jgi:hypothetical protein
MIILTCIGYLAYSYNDLVKCRQNDRCLRSVLSLKIEIRKISQIKSKKNKKINKESQIYCKNLISLLKILNYVILRKNKTM